MAGYPDKEYRTNKPPPAGRVWKGREETLPVRPLPRINLAGIHLVSDACATRKDSELE